MPRRPRGATSASFFHVMNRSVRKVPIFLSRGDYRAFVTVLEEAQPQHPVKLISYCVLPNHWHLVVGPTSTDALTRFGELVADAASPIDDQRGSAVYRRHALAVMARRALKWAWSA